MDLSDVCRLTRGCRLVRRCSGSCALTQPLRTGNVDSGHKLTSFLARASVSNLSRCWQADTRVVGGESLRRQLPEGAAAQH